MNRESLSSGFPSSSVNFSQAGFPNKLIIMSLSCQTSLISYCVLVIYFYDTIGQNRFSSELKFWGLWDYVKLALCLQFIVSSKKQIGKVPEEGQMHKDVHVDLLQMLLRNKNLYAFGEWCEKRSEVLLILDDVQSSHLPQMEWRAFYIGSTGEINK